MGTLWTDALSLHNPAAPRLRWIRFFSLLVSLADAGKGGEGPLASPLQAGRVWHQHCSIITAKSCWWKTLGLLRQAISINIYARVAGNRMKPSFWCLWRKRRKIWCKSQMWESQHKPPTQTELRNVTWTYTLTAADDAFTDLCKDSCWLWALVSCRLITKDTLLINNWKLTLLKQTKNNIIPKSVSTWV